MSDPGGRGSAELAASPSRRDASVRTDRVMAVVLATLLIGCAVTFPLSVAADWSAGGRRSLIVLVNLAFAVAYAIWLLRGTSPARPAKPQRAAIDLAAVWGLLLSGLLFELLLSDTTFVAGMENAGFVCVCASAYVGGVRLPLRSASIPLLVAAIGHLLVLRAELTAGIEGGVCILLIGIACRLVTREVKRAGLAEDQAVADVQRAERDEASARVHDALGLLRVAMRDDPSPSLLLAARAATLRTESWLRRRSGGELTIATGVRSVAAQFPDLAIELDVNALECGDPEVVAVVGRVLHTLLTNIRMHARADAIRIVGAIDGREWNLTIADDGRGFDVRAPSTGYGLNRIARTALSGIGGQLEVWSAPGAGTVVRMSAPTTQSSAGVRTGILSRRFAAWSRRPVQGRQRALFIADLGQFCLLALPTLYLIIGLDFLREHAARPDLAVALAFAGILSLVVLCLLGPRPSLGLAIAAAMVALLCGAGLTLLEGDATVIGDKIGINLMFAACVLLATGRPDARVVAAGMCSVSLLAMGSIDLYAGISVATFTVIGTIVGAVLIGSLFRSAEATDAEKQLLAELERRAAATLLLRQLSAVNATGTTGSEAAAALRTRQFDIARQAEDYLNPAAADGGHLIRIVLAQVAERADPRVRADVARGHQPAVLAPAVAETAVAALLQFVAQVPPSWTQSITVRVAELPVGWRITALLPLDAADRHIAALVDRHTGALGQAGIEVTTAQLGTHMLVAIGSAQP